MDYDIENSPSNDTIKKRRAFIIQQFQTLKYVQLITNTNSGNAKRPIAGWKNLLSDGGSLYRTNRSFYLRRFNRQKN
jgi:hypothetical protein